MFIRYCVAVFCVALIFGGVITGCGGGGGGGNTTPGTTNGANNGVGGVNNGGGNGINNPVAPGEGDEGLDEGIQPGDTENGANGGEEENGGNNGGEVALTNAFYEPWYFRTITFYNEDGTASNVGSISGTLDFERDGTFTWSHRIGTLWSEYAGTYRVEGNRIVFNDRNGNPVDPYEFSLGNIEGKDRMVLTSHYATGAKFSIIGLESSK